jgi:hypothetical protein
MQELLRTRIVNNTHRVTVEMAPDRAMEQRQASARAFRLFV